MEKQPVKLLDQAKIDSFTSKATPENANGFNTK